MNDEYVQHLAQKSEEYRIDNYLSSLQITKRNTMVKNLVQLCYIHDLKINTILKTILIFDYFLMKKGFNKYDSKLVGLGCLWIASKFVEPPSYSATDLARFISFKITPEEVIAIEMEIFKTLGYFANLPTVLDFYYGIYEKIDSPTDTIDKPLKKRQKLNDTNEIDEMVEYLSPFVSSDYGIITAYSTLEIAHALCDVSSQILGLSFSFSVPPIFIEFKRIMTDALKKRTIPDSPIMFHDTKRVAVLNFFESLH